MSVAPVFSALGEPLRRQLLETIAAQGPLTATELARLYPITRQGILKHLQVLQQAGLLTVSQYGRDKRYELSPEPLGELADWTREIGSKWEGRLQRLKHMLENGEQAGGSGT